MPTPLLTIRRFVAAEAALNAHGFRVTDERDSPLAEITHAFTITRDGRRWNFTSAEEVVAFRFGLEASDLALKRVAAIAQEALAPRAEEHPDA